MKDHAWDQGARPYGKTAQNDSGRNAVAELNDISMITAETECCEQDRTEGGMLRVKCRDRQLQCHSPEGEFFCDRCEKCDCTDTNDSIVDGK